MALVEKKSEKNIMKLRWFRIATFYAILLALSFFWMNRSQKKFTEFSITTQTQRIALRVERAQTSREIERGLSNRDTIGSDGMLFILPQEMKPAFWMKDMRFPLDFIWIRNTIIVDLTRNVPIPPPLATHTPNSSVTHVLEVPAGFIDQHKIHLGDSVEWK